MARATMAGVIQQLREMVGDDTAPYTFSESSLERILDKYQTAHRMCPLSLVTARSAGVGSIREFQAQAGTWEDGAQFFGTNYQSITAAGWNPATGVVAFDVTGGVASPPAAAFVTGFTYCMNAAAADVCDQWAAKVARAFDFQSNDQQFKRSQQATSLREQAKTFRAQIPVRSIGMTRSDV